jgi:hypothetical protein
VSLFWTELNSIKEGKGWHRNKAGQFYVWWLSSRFLRETALTSRLPFLGGKLLDKMKMDLGK